MTCEICGKLPTLPSGKTKVTINLLDYTVKDKLVPFLDKKGIQYESKETIINLMVDSLEEFVLNIVEDEKVFTSLEMSSINITFLNNNEGELFGALKNLKTLSSLYYLIKSKDIIDVLKKNRINTFFHPIVDIQRSEIYGYECLLRAYKDNGEIINPGYMFDIAKKNGLIYYLDREARRVALNNSAKHKVDKFIFINFIPTTIYDPQNCLRETLETAKKLNFHPSQIVFEVVETEEVKDIDLLVSILDYYRKHGYKVALDDIGSGYSSLKLLSRLQPDFIKIDMDIIRDIDKDCFKQSILKALVSIAKENNIKIIAEGIETEGEYKYCEELGVDYGQGYYFAKPDKVPKDKI